MKQTIKRKTILPVLMLITGCMMGFTTLLQLSMGSPVALINLVACILFMINAIWSFSTPLVSIDDTTVFFKEALMRQKEISIMSIERIDVSNKRYVDIYRKHDSKVRIRFSSMASADKEDFMFAINEINQNYSTLNLSSTI